MRKICAKPPLICFAICASWTPSTAFLSLRSAFQRPVLALRSMTDFAGPLPLMRETRLNETFEKRMRLVRLALKLGVILAGEKVRMVAQLNQFGERSIG